MGVTEVLWMSRWSQILDQAPDASGRWWILPDNGWGALIAFVAGPGNVRPHRNLWWTATAPDTEILEDVNDYLRIAGVEASPEPQWEIRLPAGMTLLELEKRIGSAESIEPLPQTPEGWRRRQVVAIRTEVEAIFGHGRPKSP
jgi:hypothetical protein